MSAPLSRFTPSLMPHEVLERLFVARDRTLDAIMERVTAAATSDGRNHTLLVGPRGAGKTHLVSLVYHRTKQLQAEGARLQPAWLPEDPWTLVTYRHLLTEIAKRVEPPLEGELPRDAKELELRLARHAAAGGPIVVIVENLDQILDAVGDDGQQRLRHLLQADRSLLLVATSTRLDRTLADQASPFYGFFTTTRLEPFDADEAAAMLTAIARDRNDERLVEYLASDEGHTRLRTICHLAGGQPRMWAALASALSVEGLDELVELLLARFDDLTPYYQEQLARLSGQQRLVVAELAELDRPINVKDLAERLEVDQRSLAKTMSDLVDRGWATPMTSAVTVLLDKRRTYYELAEPLARLSFQIKESRGEPLRLVVEFLKHWFEPEELTAPQPAGLASTYIYVAREGQHGDPVVAATRRLQRLPATRGPAVELLAEIDIALATAETDPEPFLRLPTPVRAVLETKLESWDLLSVRMEIHELAQLEFGFTRHPAMAAWIERAQALIDGAPPSIAARVLPGLLDWLGRAWRFDEANEVLGAISALSPPVDESIVRIARGSLAQAHWEAGHTEQAIALSDALVARYRELFGAEHTLTLMSAQTLSTYLQRAGHGERAVDLANEVVDHRRCISGANHRETFQAEFVLSSAFRAVGRFDEAIKLETAALARAEDAFGATDEIVVNARGSLAASLIESDRAAEAVELLEPVVVAQKQAPRPPTESTLGTRRALVLAYMRAGRLPETLSSSDVLVDDHLRVFGPDHPDTLLVQFTHGMVLVFSGRTAEGLAVMRAAATTIAEVLGDDHPSSRLMNERLQQMESAENSTQ